MIDNVIYYHPICNGCGKICIEFYNKPTMHIGDKYASEIIEFLIRHTNKCGYKNISITCIKPLG